MSHKTCHSKLDMLLRENEEEMYKVRRCTSLIYKTWCADCLKRHEDSNGGEGGIYKYIGETAKSAYERGANHLYDRKNLDLESHMLKHAL